MSESLVDDHDTSIGHVDTSAEQARNVVVTKKETIAEGVVLIEFADPDGHELPVWEPGSHIDVVIPGDIVRQYSLCGDAGDRSVWQIAVLREIESRGGSEYLHDTLAEGDRILVRGPRNNFPFEPAEKLIFVAGGIGVTPMLPMVAAAEARGVEWELLYGGRSRSSMGFVEMLENTYGEHIAVRPQDEFGLLDLASLLGKVRADTAVYCCGPEPLLQAIESACAPWPKGTLHLERFAPKEIGEPVRNESFEVECQMSGKTITVPPDKSIVAVMQENDIPIVVSCQEGTCGSCETVIIEGVPEHRDSILTEAERAENETMMVCVGRAVTPRLVLDI
ncbi:PDR/VanB family oxidoreductase [Gordonia terrae]|uniref:PDR/VanB family oxidoreductase n=1 Tax=Gordonia terrae TaxID=2055 RepID=UPI003F6A991D